MAEDKELTPLSFKEDYRTVFQAAVDYFMPDENQYKITGQHITERGFTINLYRAYNFIANDYKATLHLDGIPTEEGGTDILITGQSKDTAEELEKAVHERFLNGINRKIAANTEAAEIAKDTPPLSPEELADKQRREKRAVIITLAIGALIIIGTLPTACMSFGLLG